MLTIEFSSKSKQVFLSIYDLNGKRVQQQMLDAKELNQNEISVSNLSAGAYVLSLETKQGIVKALFVKQ